MLWGEIAGGYRSSTAPELHPVGSSASRAFPAPERPSEQVSVGRGGRPTPGHTTRESQTGPRLELRFSSDCFRRSLTQVKNVIKKEVSEGKKPVCLYMVEDAGETGKCSLSGVESAGFTLL